MMLGDKVMFKKIAELSVLFPNIDVDAREWDLLTNDIIMTVHQLDDPWIHVMIENKGGDRVKVKVPKTSVKKITDEQIVL
jgi:hypothetical protein